jgi:putative DNA primase/helicase
MAKPRFSNDENISDVSILDDPPGELERLAGVGTDAPGSAPAQRRGKATTIGLASADKFKVEPIRWIWRGWLAAGKVHILAGSPGTGKTSIGMAVAATITLGGRWPDGTLADPGHVVIWSGEDDPSDTLIPRLIAAGADLTRVHVVTGAQDASGSRSFDPSGDVLALADTLADMDPPPALLIVDPIVSAVAGDSHKNAEVRRALQPLVDLAMIRRVAVLGITHFSKGSAGRDPVERVTGSLAFGALARVVMATAKRSEDDGGGRILARGKSNIGRDDGGYLYDFEVCEALPGIETTRILWGDPIEGSARELLGQAETLTDPDDRSAIEDAAEWLREQLGFGSIEGAKIKKMARAEGISERTLYRAADTIGVERKGNGFAKSRVWSLMSAMSAKCARLKDVANMDGNHGMSANPPKPAHMADMENLGTHGPFTPDLGTHGRHDLGTHGTHGTHGHIEHETTENEDDTEAF